MNIGDIAVTKYGWVIEIVVIMKLNVSKKTIVIANTIENRFGVEDRILYAYYDLETISEICSIQ